MPFSFSGITFQGDNYLVLKFRYSALKKCIFDPYLRWILTRDPDSSQRVIIAFRRQNDRSLAEAERLQKQ